ncbi:MAG: nucleotidyltransferase family protein, partial [Gammaproteobacteria bacterium]|nr:nucleotidyltransferase family protein [Gammaproteobacteria bacterium]
MPADNPLIKVLLDPSLLPSLTPVEQTLVLRQARQAALLGYIEARIEPLAASGKLADHLLAAKIHADYHDQMISWETERLGRVLGDLQGPVILLKGAAYKALELGLSQGRLASDVDLLLPRDQLPEAERRLLSSGWKPLKEDEYEQHYYREWMHELPPLRHQERGTVVDLHHTILPLTARLRPDPAKLIAAALPMDEGPFSTLCPEDTV